ncbi:hypothetical protein SDRG_16854 [Saprolegnia diclina VS20]|uniref:Uncharacterized protein n=1 Tax=Saprolegnia diclina (strain VS20) TaxID=1156394 RepID=T0PIS5_SAPDV|nr:hypothetical protein SDRG_16854 [Saprolegnia diclina VS20]EQC25274.1 hypothetical protein SDRG_16854 [Saprolegnia diclina VS20]|eukprot:XP_008621299.1 hypothetical protein SDRG_16854 [Saprolegnia diclina VS20]
MLATVKSEDSEATVPSDRDGIFELIRAETSFVAVDRLIFSTLSSWIRTTLEASIAATSSLVEKAKRWRQLGLIADNLNEYVTSERCFREARALYDHVEGPLDAETLMLQSLVAFAMAHQGKPQSEWEPLFRDTLALATEHLGETHPSTLATRSNLVKSLGQFGDFVAALPLALDDFERRRSLHGLYDYRTANILSEIGKIYVHLAEPRMAMRWLRKAFSIREALLGHEHASTMATLSLLVVALMYMGAAVEAAALAKDVAASRARTLGAEHPNTLESRLNEAACMLMTGDAEAATSALLSLQTLYEARHDLAPWLPIVYHDLGIAYAMLGKTDLARAYYIRNFQNVPTKFHAWLFFDTVLRFAPASVAEDLALVRDFVESTADDAPESWLESCVVCYRPILGSTVACAACPHDIYKFCTRCRDQRPSRLRRFCRHDPQATSWRTTVPPRRFFYEAALRSTANANYDDIELLFAAYETYCGTHKVPANERLARASIPSLNLGWHPM